MPNPNSFITNLHSELVPLRIEKSTTLTVSGGKLPSYFVQFRHGLKENSGSISECNCLVNVKSTLPTNVCRQLYCGFRGPEVRIQLAIATGKPVELNVCCFFFCICNSPTSFIFPN